jgi:diguanylate cyclase (GGDEF)-like protein
VAALALGTWHRVGDVEPEAARAALLERARSYGEQAQALLAQLTEPTYAVTVAGNLGEVLLHQGHPAQARQMLDRAHREALALGLAAHAWRIEASRGAWLLAQERPEEALAAMTALLAEMAALDGPPPVYTEIRARDVAYKACRMLGWYEAALAHFEVVERLERQRTVAQLRALSQIFITRSEAQQARRTEERRTDEARAEAVRQRLRAQAMAQSAEQDALTGLANRRHFERRIGELLARQGAADRPLALALLDVDHFKLINDRFGHPACDAVLVGLAQLLRENMRGGDVLARLGGEEFVIVLPDTTPERAREVCERLRERIECRAWPECPGLGPVTASIGLAMTAPAAPAELAALMKHADQALYAAKGAGRNRLVVAATGG